MSLWLSILCLIVGSLLLTDVFFAMKEDRKPYYAIGLERVFKYLFCRKK